MLIPVAQKQLYGAGITLIHGVIIIVISLI